MLLTAAAILVLPVLPQQAAAANGVHFDADSPAGKEYALPLEQAREEAAGVGKSDGPAGEKAPLFGEGVSSGGGGGGGGGGNAGGGVGTPTSGNGGGQSQVQGARPHAPAAAAAALADEGDGYALSSALLWVAAIVALGGVVALALRGLQRPRPT